MSRQERKNRTDIIIKGAGQINDAFDDAMKTTWYINDEEYDYICKYATDDELEMVISTDFSDKRKALGIVDRLIEQYKFSENE